MFTLIVDPHEIWALRTLLHGWFLAETQRLVALHRRAIETSDSSPEFLQVHGPGYKDKVDFGVSHQIMNVFNTVRSLDNIMSAATLMFPNKEAVLSLPEPMFTNLRNLLTFTLNVGTQPEEITIGEKLKAVLPALRDAFDAAAVNAANPVPNVTPPPKGMLN